MKKISLSAGSTEWVSARSASKAASVMGFSKNTSRDEMLCFMSSGIGKGFTDWQQANLLDKGHLTEIGAREIAEGIIGDDLIPTSCSTDDGYLTAAPDGITFDGSIGLEAKTWNEKLAECVRNKDVPDTHWPQLEQQIYVCGLDYVLFMVSDGTKEKTVSMEYRAVPGRMELLLASWKQFDIDREKCVPVEVIEMPKAEVVIDLPALFIHAKGEITDSNMAAFGLALTKKLAEIRAIKLVDDQDFSNAKAAAKKFRETAKAIVLSKSAMLAQTDTIGEAATKMDAWAKDLNETALQLEKDVEREDLTKKRAMVAETGLAYSAHVEALEAETRPIQLSVVRPDFPAAIKGKSKYASMQSALNDALAAGKMAADAQAKDLRAKLAWCKETSTGFGFLFSDLGQIIAKPMDDFQLLVTSRIEAHKKAETERVEAERAAMQAAADAKAKAEADAILAAERVKAEAEQQALVAAGVKAQLEVQVKAATAAMNSAPNKLAGEAIEQAMKDAATTGTGIIKTDGKKVEVIAHEAIVLKHGTKEIEIKPRAVYVPSSRPTRAELIDAISSHFGTTNETALEWLLDEFDPKVYAGQQQAKEAV